MGWVCPTTPWPGKAVFVWQWCLLSRSVKRRKDVTAASYPALVNCLLPTTYCVVPGSGPSRVVPGHTVAGRETGWPRSSQEQPFTSNPPVSSPPNALSMASEQVFAPPNMSKDQTMNSAHLPHRYVSRALTSPLPSPLLHYTPHTAHHTPTAHPTQ